MTDDHQIRALLTRAAELPDDIQPPVARLVETARRARLLRITGSVLTVAVLTAAAATLPFALHALFPRQGGHSVGSYAATKPTAAELSRFGWSSLPPSPLGERSAPLLAWTGSKLIELGGTRKGVTQSDGAVFDAATGRWALIAHVRGNVGFSNAIDVWTGSLLFVTNGQTASCPGRAPVSRCLPRAGLFDPATNRWTTTLLPRPLDGLTLVGAVWTGRDVVLAAASYTHPRLAVAAYNVATRHWRMITPRLPRRHPPQSAALVAAGGRVIVWSLWSRNITYKNGSGTIRFGVDVLGRGPSGRWSHITGNWPQNRYVDGPVYAAGKILIPPSEFWCGMCPGPLGQSPARLADAATLALTSVPDGPLVTKPMFEPPLWLWNGRAAVAATLASGDRLGRLAAYDPVSRRWYVLPSPPGRPVLGAGPVFAGDRLLVLARDGSLLALRR